MKKKGQGPLIVSILVLLLLWHLVSLYTGSALILPSPLLVIKDGIRLIFDPIFFKLLTATFFRGLGAFVISVLLSTFLGLASGISSRFSAMLSPWMTIIKSTPVVSFILIALFWFGSSMVPVFVSVLMTLPVMTEAIASGIRQTDIRLLEMARIYRFRKRDILVHIQIPSALPFFLAGAGSALGLTWKVVVAGEILALPRWGLGSAMQTAKVHLETSRVFSLTVITILLSLVTELLFSYCVKKSQRHLEIVTEKS